MIFLFFVYSCIVIVMVSEIPNKRDSVGLTEERNAACFLGIFCQDRRRNHLAASLPVPVLTGLETLFLIYFFLVSLTGKMYFIGSSVRSVGFICFMGYLPGQIQSKSLMSKLSPSWLGLVSIYRGSIAFFSQ